MAKNEFFVSTAENAKIIVSMNHFEVSKTHVFHQESEMTHFSFGCLKMSKFSISLGMQGMTLKFIMILVMVISYLSLYIL